MSFTTLVVCLMLQAPVADSIKTLPTVTVAAGREEAKTESQSSSEVSIATIERNFQASLAQSLESVSGVKAVPIGSGLSRPTIRGMGFNRLVVSENGIKHESQQWGDDHGLEIDQFAVDAVEIIKGPATLLYGSDAIGGVMNVTSNRISAEPLNLSVTTFARSNNNQIGIALRLAGRHNGWFYKLNLTESSSGDYRVPADSIQYYSYWIKLRDNRLRNTAGKERDGRIMIGWTNRRNLRTDITVSDVFSRSGFYADAHGLEVRLSNIDYDRSLRDIDLPSQWVNHLKIHSRTAYTIGSNTIVANLAWQNNRRGELSEPISHGYMPTPKDSLERFFDKQTLTGTVSISRPLGELHTLKGGATAEYQRNRRDGWGFIIPDYETSSIGFFASEQWIPSNKTAFNCGLRYDHIGMHIHSYTDWYATPTSNGTSDYMQRATEAEHLFNSLTWSAGFNIHNGPLIARLNAGKAFRAPIAKELSANGINYHIFRFEQGNDRLKAEQSYQLDAGIEWNGEKVAAKVEPYFNYFPNFIYLSPSSEYVEGLQLYRYEQTRALRYGVDVELSAILPEEIELAVRGQYCRSVQLSGAKQGYTLPFATPPSLDIDLSRHFTSSRATLIGINIHAVATQSEIVPPEKATSGFITINISASHMLQLNKHTLTIALQIGNLLNTKYFDHTSYYRLIDIPEPGRNISLRVKYGLKKQRAF